MANRLSLHVCKWDGATPLILLASSESLPPTRLRTLHVGLRLRVVIITVRRANAPSTTAGWNECFCTGSCALPRQIFAGAAAAAAAGLTHLQCGLSLLLLHLVQQWQQCIVVSLSHRLSHGPSPIQLLFLCLPGCLVLCFLVSQLLVVVCQVRRLTQSLLLYTILGALQNELWALRIKRRRVQRDRQARATATDEMRAGKSREETARKAEMMRSWSHRAENRAGV